MQESRENFRTPSFELSNVGQSSLKPEVEGVSRGIALLFVEEGSFRFIARRFRFFTPRWVIPRPRAPAGRWSEANPSLTPTKANTSLELDPAKPLTRTFPLSSEANPSLAPTRAEPSLELEPDKPLARTFPLSSEANPSLAPARAEPSPGLSRSLPRQTPH